MTESRKSSKRVYFAILLVALIIIVALIFAYQIYFPSQTTKSSTSSSEQWMPIELNSENLPAFLESTPIIHDLPDESLISLTIGDSKYKLEKDSVVSGDLANPDVEITLPEKYFDIIGQNGLCYALTQAQNNNDLGISFSGSTTSLAWKYRALGKYKSCLGM